MPFKLEEVKNNNNSRIANQSKNNGIDNLLVIKASIYAILISLYLIFIPFNKLVKKVGISTDNSLEDVDINMYRSAREISYSITRAIKYLPFSNKSIIKAIVAQRLMKEAKIPATIYLGKLRENCFYINNSRDYSSNNKYFSKNKSSSSEKLLNKKEQDRKIYAWLKCGSYYVTGGESYWKYKIVARASN